jgi:hypothetical protein
LLPGPLPLARANNHHKLLFQRACRIRFGKRVGGWAVAGGFASGNTPNGRLFRPENKGLFGKSGQHAARVDLSSRVPPACLVLFAVRMSGCQDVVAGRFHGGTIEARSGGRATPKHGCVGAEMVMRAREIETPDVRNENRKAAELNDDAPLYMFVQSLARSALRPHHRLPPCSAVSSVVTRRPSSAPSVRQSKT